MLTSAWMRGWLYHGQHLTASAVYGRELYASEDVAFYAAICVAFPIIGAIMGAFGSGMARMTGPLTDGDRPPGPPGPDPVPAPPDGARLAGAGADEGVSLAAHVRGAVGRRGRGLARGGPLRGIR